MPTHHTDLPPKRAWFLIYLSPALIACLAITAVIYVRQQPAGVGGDHELGEDSYREVLQLIENNQVAGVSREDLIYGALDGIVRERMKMALEEAQANLAHAQSRARF